MAAQVEEVWEVANMVGHEAGAWAEDGQVAAALLHLLELVGEDGLAQLVVADAARSRAARACRPERGDLFVAPGGEGGGAVV